MSNEYKYIVCYFQVIHYLTHIIQSSEVKSIHDWFNCFLIIKFELGKLLSSSSYQPQPVVAVDKYGIAKLYLHDICILHALKLRSSIVIKPKLCIYI